MTTLRQLGRIAVAMLAITGRVTMLGLARWTGTGGSYRTVQRFFHTTLPWAAILWVLVRTPAESPAPTVSTAAKRKPGHPKGSSTQAKADAPLNAEHARISTLIQGRLTRIRPHLTLTYLVLDGHFGNHNAVLMARRLGLHLISKLRSDSALYAPYDGPYAGRGPRRISGERINPTSIPERFLKQASVEEGIETDLSGRGPLQDVCATPQRGRDRQAPAGDRQARPCLSVQQRSHAGLGRQPFSPDTLVRTRCGPAPRGR